jgi:hypothetical protein
VKTELPQIPQLTLTTYIAALFYIILSMTIWIPIGILMGTINPGLTIMIFVMYFIKEVCRIYLGIKV